MPATVANRSTPLLAVVLLGCRPPHAGTAMPPASSPVASMTVRDADGEIVRFDALQRDVTLVSLWASYCGSCEATLPGLEALARRYADDPQVAIVAIGVDDRELVGQAQAHLGERAPSLAGYYAEKPEMISAILPRKADGSPVVGVPSTLVIDRAGRIHAVQPGEDADAQVELIEQARRGELTPLAPEQPDPFMMRVRRVAAGVEIRVLRLPSHRDRAAAAILEVALAFGATDTPELRREIEAALDGGTLLVPARPPGASRCVGGRAPEALASPCAAVAPG